MRTNFVFTPASVAGNVRIVDASHSLHPLPKKRATSRNASRVHGASCAHLLQASSPAALARKERLQPLVVTSASAEEAVASVEAVDENDAEAAQDLKDIQDIIETVELLKSKRQMTVQETRLVLMIEDPREAERRKQLGVESESGCSRDEIAAAFMEVMEDRVPADRMTLRKLAQEMREWPRLREDEDGEQAGGRRQSLYAQVTDVGLRRGRRGTADWDAAAEAAQAEAAAEKDKQKDLGETLPPWVGYGVLYGVSSIPIIIGVLVVIILFVNSLQ